MFKSQYASYKESDSYDEDYQQEGYYESSEGSYDDSYDEVSYDDSSDEASYDEDCDDSYGGDYA